MKNFKFKIMWLGCTILAFASCNETGTKSEKTTSTSQRARLASTENDSCITICQPKISFCGITEAELDAGIKNYRNGLWTKASPYFQSHTMQQYVAAMAQNGGITLDAKNFDTRYVDINLDELESYIQFIHTSGNRDKVQGLRMYYIQYGRDYTDENMRDKHSIAIVPLGLDNEDYLHPEDRSFENVGGKEGCTATMVINRLTACPPEPPRCSSRIRTIDASL